MVRRLSNGCLIGCLISVMACLMVSCRATRVTTETIQNDSVRVEIVERIKYVVDTIEVVVPYYHEARETRDTMSFLENPFALSSAAISNGVLFHSLQTIPRTWRVKFQKPILRRDSIVYRNFYRDVKVEVERELSWLQRFQINGFWGMLFVVLILILLRWGGRD